jgi:protein-S-isoprenylcysteine O-methyltransferase Ste14
MSNPGAFIGLCWVVLWIYWLISALSAKKSVRSSSRWSSGVIRLVILFAVVFLVRLIVSRSFLADIARRAHAPGGVAATIGVIVCVAGVALAIWARVHIGRNWGMPTSLREDPELVTSGPYAYVRHPIYSGLLLAMLGSALAASPNWLALFAACFVYFVYAARVEEGHMTKQFPDVYPAYQRRTKMLIPFLL